MIHIMPYKPLCINRKKAILQNGVNANLGQSAEQAIFKRANGN